MLWEALASQQGCKVWRPQEARLARVGLWPGVTYLGFRGLLLLCVSLPATSAWLGPLIWSHLGRDFAGSQFPVACLQLLFSITLQETLSMGRLGNTWALRGHNIQNRTPHDVPPRGTSTHFHGLF